MRQFGLLLALALILSLLATSAADIGELVGVHQWWAAAEPSVPVVPPDAEPALSR